LDMRDIVGADRTNAMFLALDHEMTVPGCLNVFQHFLLSSFRSTGRRRSLAENFMQAHAKMFFPLMELASYFGLGQRQLERRVHEIFGVPLRDVRRLARWGLCLQRLVNSEVRHGDLTRIAQDSGYFDQAHMTREFVEFSGMAPLPLLKGRAGNDPAYWAYRIRGKDYHNLFIPVD
jgi:AraC-like DNA-binding protein